MQVLVAGEDSWQLEGSRVGFNAGSEAAESFSRSGDTIVVA